MLTRAFILFAIPFALGAQTRTPADTNVPLPKRGVYKHNAGPIQTTFDRSKNLSTTATKPVDSGVGDLKVYASFTFPGQTFKVDPQQTVSLSFQSKSSSWKFLRDHDVTFTLDGKPFRVERPANTDGFVIERNVNEYITLTMTRNEFARLANAKRADVTIGKVSGTLTEGVMQSLKDIASRLAP